MAAAGALTGIAWLACLGCPCSGSVARLAAAAGPAKATMLKLGCVLS